MKGRQGHTLLEVLVVLTLTSLVTGIVLAAWSSATRSQRSSDRRRTVEREARQALSLLYRDLAGASYIYFGYSGIAGGRKYSVPAAGVTGQEILFAIPENEVQGGQTYTLEGWFSQNLLPSDPNNSGGQQLTVWTKTGLRPPTADHPASLDLAGVTGGISRSYRTYHLNGGFALQSIQASTVSLRLSYALSQPGGPCLRDDYYLEVNARNL
jgi:type II secretory pathway pseudopilin PulG